MAMQARRVEHQGHANRLAKEVPLTETFKGVMPFLASDLLRIVMLLAFPSVSLVLVHVLHP